MLHSDSIALSDGIAPSFDIPVAAVFSKSDNVQALKELVQKKP
jgi:hypothetical protein